MGFGSVLNELGSNEARVIGSAVKLDKRGRSDSDAMKSLGRILLFWNIVFSIRTTEETKRLVAVSRQGTRSVASSA